MNNIRQALEITVKEMERAIPHLDIHFDDYFEAINFGKEALSQPSIEPTLIGIDFAQDMWKSRMIEFLKEKQICSFDNNKIIIQGWIQELENDHE